MKMTIIGNAAVFISRIFKYLCLIGAIAAFIAGFIGHGCHCFYTGFLCLCGCYIWSIQEIDEKNMEDEL